jgi:hypothetical protein
MSSLIRKQFSSQTSSSCTGPTIVRNIAEILDRLFTPVTTVTPKTASSPRGKIFSDKGRGTLFWEVADTSDEEEGLEHLTQEKDRGSVFQIEWIRRYSAE